MFVWQALPGRASARPGAFLAVPALESHGIRVAFTTRTGGVSAEPFASLNLSFLSGDAPGDVEANRERALDAVGAGPDAWTSGQQIHGAGVAHADAALAGAGAHDPGTTIADVDGLWTDEPGVALAVLTADCVPVLVADTRRRAIATLHAGWRGLTLGVLRAGTQALIDGGSDPSDLQAFVGPAIGPCCFEVGDEVAEPMREAFGDEVVVPREDGKPHVDLWTGARISLAQAGVRSVWMAAMCTRSEPHRFFSHRAGADGRQGLVAVLA